MCCWLRTPLARLVAPFINTIRKNSVQNVIFRRSTSTTAVQNIVQHLLCRSSSLKEQDFWKQVIRNLNQEDFMDENLRYLGFCTETGKPKAASRSQKETGTIPCLLFVSKFFFTSIYAPPSRQVMNKLHQLLPVIHGLIFADHEIRLNAFIDVVHSAILDHTDLQRTGNGK